MVTDLCLTLAPRFGWSLVLHSFGKVLNLFSPTWRNMTQNCKNCELLNDESICLIDHFKNASKIVTFRCW